MKQTFTEIKIYLFCLLSTFLGGVTLAQNTSSSNLVQQDSLSPITKDQILETPFGTFNLSKSTGAVYRISGETLRKTPGDNLSEALRGRVPGLRIVSQSNTPGFNNYSYTLNGGTPYVLIDGQPRGLQVDLREVEEVIILNDATFNSLMGILGDNGLIYVITRGGKNDTKPVVEVNYQRGLNTSTRMPNLLSAAEYARVINKVSNNDGLGPVYSQADIQAYENGSDPIGYPNVDYQDTFLEESSPSNFASLSVYGGSKKLAYGAFVGYSDWRGLEKVGNPITGRSITFRTKIKAQINDLIETFGSVYGKFGENDRPVLDASTMFNWISGTPANAFPLKVGDSAYIVSNQFNNNLLAELEAGGTRTDYEANMIFDFGFNFDFKDYVPGLKYNTYLMMRTFNSQSLQADNTPALYTLETYKDVNNQDALALKVYTTEVNTLDVSRNQSDVLRNFAYGGNLSYVKDLGEGVLNLNANHLLYYQPTPDADVPDVRQLTFNLNGSFALQNKYIMYANLNSSNSSKFIGNNRTNFFPTLGVSWIASNEDFLKDNKVINFLKFRTSYGIVGTEYTADKFLYLDTWTRSNKAYYGAGQSNQTQSSYQVSQTGNQAIDWIIYNQFFAGLELQMFNKLSLNFNYFNTDIEGQITNASELYAQALGNNAYLPALNYTNRKNQGFNSSIFFRNNENDFKYYLGVNAGYNKIKGVRIAEVQYPDQYRLQEGQAEDNIMGYVSDGLYTTNNIANALPQFGDVRVGDVKYKDLNGDNVIDSRDQKAIGNSTPRFNYGINIGASFKGINLDVVGVGVASYDIDLSNVPYYQHSGLGSYYGSINSNLPNGNANPRLGNIKSDNNYRSSDYWLVDGGYFRISTMELGYTLSDKVISKSPFNAVKFFLRGNNLALFSKMKDLDPEDTRSGVSEYPMMRSYFLGTTISF
ncbi:SusC/RagA family TonB-linked outer membrane protein [Tamlana sp. I1]|uniref:SusC/RagA family TonB-linked outer membrane protein n=1 Tax=Tamlana sp. I1 TaxID=2762061 RepID=UPI00188E7C04|nr:SusC/RagA family TonB-linked outer membrane protein [Tamlana sp. I1]